MRAIALLTAAGLMIHAPAVTAQMADPDNPVEGGGTLPAGWAARTDGDRPMANVKFVTMGNGLHVTLGPAAIFWREADRVSGPFHAEVTYTQTKAPQHPEAYGMFLAGQDLKEAGQSYVYFLVRKDGKFLVKRRTGTTTSNVTEGWTDHAAVVKEDAAGKATNKMEIAVDAAGKVSFKVNGQEVHTMTDPAATRGVVGLRVNHNLDLHIAGFGVHPM